MGIKLKLNDDQEEDEDDEDIEVDDDAKEDTSEQVHHRLSKKSCPCIYSDSLHNIKNQVKQTICVMI